MSMQSRESEPELKKPLRSLRSFHREIGAARAGERVDLCAIDPAALCGESSYSMIACLGGALIIRRLVRNGKPFVQCFQNGIEKADLVLEGADVAVMPYAADAVSVFDGVVSHILTGRLLARIPRGAEKQWIAAWQRHIAGFTVAAGGKLLLNGVVDLGMFPEGSICRNFGPWSYVQRLGGGKFEPMIHQLPKKEGDPRPISLESIEIASESEWRPWIGRTAMIRTDPDNGSIYLHSGHHRKRGYSASDWYLAERKGQRSADGSSWETHELGAICESWREDSLTEALSVRARDFCAKLSLAPLGFAHHPRGILVSSWHSGEAGRRIGICLLSLDSAERKQA